MQHKWIIIPVHVWMYSLLILSWHSKPITYAWAVNSLQLVQETACKLNPCKKVTNLFSISYMYPYEGGENHTVTYTYLEGSCWWICMIDPYFLLWLAIHLFSLLHNDSAISCKSQHLHDEIMIKEITEFSFNCMH